MTLLNIEYVFPNLEIISLNLVHKNLQEFINNQSIHKMTKLLLNTEYTKKNYIKDNISKYSIKWYFKAEFDFAYYNNIKINSKKIEIIFQMRNILILYISMKKKFTQQLKVSLLSKKIER